MSEAGVPILTWHAMNVAGDDYARNDLVAFGRDIETIHAMGLRIVPLRDIVDALAASELGRLHGCVGITLDDGSDFDFHDLPHPTWGPQRGFFNILADFRAKHGAHAQPRLHATTFAIVSPEARAELDRTCMIGCRWWNDDWWGEAEASGLMAVESHTWDHNHESLERTATTAPRGAFDVRSAEEARAEIVQAAEWMRVQRGRAGDVLLAYPYGDASHYLVDEWLPAHGVANGIPAAIASDPMPVTLATNRWKIPRFVFRRDWKQEGDLERLLQRVSASPTAAPAPPLAISERPVTWRQCLRTWEIGDPRVVAGDLFSRHFGHPLPDYPRHFVLVYSPPSTEADPRPRVVAYEHQTPFEGVHLGGGMVVDATIYRKMPKALFEQIRDEGGLATIITRDCIAMLGDSAASFGFVGEPRARAADLRTGYVDTGKEKLMVYWRRDLPGDEKAALIERVAALGPF